MAKQSGEAYWRDVLDRWRLSGEPVQGFCVRQGVSRRSFYRWRRRLGVEGSEGAGPTQRSRQHPGAKFVELAVSSSCDGSPPLLEIVFKSSDVVVRVPAGFDRRALSDVVAVVRSSSPC